ncbi:hypothetical protein Tco_0697644 [Tanacetum coccineum]
MCITFKTAKLWLENLFLLQAWDNLFESKAQLIRGSARIAYQTCFQDVKIKDVSDDECDLPPYDDSSKNHDFTFSNPLFDIDEDFTLSDESFSEEDIPKENFIIFSNPLFDLDEEIASTKVDRINDEVLECIHSIHRVSPVNSSFLNQFHQKLRKLNLTRKVIFCFWKVCSTITLLLDLRKLSSHSNAIESLPSILQIPVAIMILLWRRIDVFLAETDQYHQDCPDCEDSQFCHSSRVSHPQLHLGIRYPNLID